MITADEILELLGKAQLFGVRYSLYCCFGCEYGIQFEMDKSIFHLRIRKNKIVSPSDFGTIEQIINYMNKKCTEKTKEEKRKELLASLTTEEKELLGLK